MKKELNLQHFAEASAVIGTSTKGSRVFVSSNIVPTVTDMIVGVRSTPDKGSDTNKQDVTTITDTSIKETLGLTGTTSGSFTFILVDKTMDQQISKITGTHWVYEEYVDSSSDLTKIGIGILMKVQFGALRPTGQSPDGVREFTQDFTMVSESYYLATPTYTGTTATWVYKDLVSGATVSTPK